MKNNTKLAKEWFDAAENTYKYALSGSKDEDVYPDVGFSAHKNSRLVKVVRRSCRSGAKFFGDCRRMRNIEFVLY
ncbi:hypothetical protein HY085_02070 [Candidatus Gottesmanbacteria bacterium]|nr:hypothetical protein [Candidatus Gottesmanbacteria bacterium]